jgi:hypothetical protein
MIVRERKMVEPRRGVEGSNAFGIVQSFVVCQQFDSRSLILLSREDPRVGERQTLAQIRTRAF